MSYVQYWRDKLLGCLGATLVVFGFPYLMEDTPLALYGGLDENEQRRARLVAFYGLDRSLPEQYGTWLYRMVSGQWGDSRFYQRSVWHDARRAMAQTAVLLGWTLVVTAIWIWLWHQLSRWRRPGLAGRQYNALAWGFWLILLPSFIAAILVRDVLLWRFGWLNMAHLPAFVPFYLFNPIYMGVPAMLLALVPCAVWTTVSPAPRAGQPTSLRQSAAHFCRRFRPLLAGMLFEVFLLEQVLSMPGLGRMGLAALKRRDIPMLQGFILCTLILYLVLGLWLDWGAKRRRRPPTWLAASRSTVPHHPVSRQPMRHQRRYRGLLGMLLLLAIAIWTPQLAPYDPSAIHSDDQLLRLSYRYALGTDFLGRDVLSRTLGGFRAELPQSWLILLLAGGTGGLLIYLGRYVPHWLWPLIRAGLAVCHMLPTFLVVLLTFLVLYPWPWSIEVALLLGLLPTTLYLLSRRRPLAERLLSLAQIGGEALLFLVIFHFLNLVPNAVAPTWGSDLRMGMRYSQNNAWLLAGPSLALLWAYYSFYLTGLARVTPPRGGVTTTAAR